METGSEKGSEGREMTNLTTATIDQSKLDQLSQTVADPLHLELIRCALSLAVHMAIHDLQRIGGPQDYHISAICHRAAQQRDNGSGCADMLFGGKQAGREMALLCDMAAVMAFVPGGVKLFGLHFEACAESEVQG